MKKLFLICIFALVYVSILASCKDAPAINKDINSISDDIQTQNNEISIAAIVDETNVRELVDAEEVFFEDETHKYIFSNPISNYIKVIYTDGNSENIKDAFSSGKANISDLDKFEINYYAESKIIESIVDIVEHDNLVTASAIEPFFEDEDYVYSFSSIRSHYVIVTFKDGTQKNIKEALSDGSAKICDLDWFGISYYKDIK